MVKKIITASMVAASLMLSGCGDAEGEARLSAQNAIDTGDYSAALALLEAKPAAERTDAENMTLASAYMGAAGVSFVEVVSLMGTDDGNSSGFESFAKQLDEQKTPETLANIDKAIEAYSAMSTINVSAPSKAITATDEAGDEALFLGMAYMTKATIVMSYLGDIENLGNNDPALEDSAFAMECVYVGTKSCIYTNDSAGNVLITGLPNGGTRLGTPGTTDGSGAIILTDYTDNSIAVDVNYTIKEALIDTINGAFDTIVSFAPDEVKQDIIDYKADMDKSPQDGYISTTEIADYINR